MEKTKRKFNLVDLVVVLALVAVLVFVALKFMPNDVETMDMNQYKVVFYTEESPNYALERIEIGNPVSDADHNYEMGEVTQEIETSESEGYVQTSDGKYVKAAKEGYSSAKVTFVGDGTDYKHGVKFDKGQYSVGQTVSIRVGNVKLYGRIYDIEKVEE